MRARRFWAALGSVALVLGSAAPSVAAPSTTPLRVPTSMAALGDSITIAYDIKSLLRADPTYSWSTGTQSAVNSLYSRLEARDATPNLSRANHAVSGAKIGDLAVQAGKVAPGTELVTVLMGANDACTSTEAGMTSAADFRTRADAALGVLADRGVDQIVVASIPDIYKLWEVGSKSSSARFVWGLYKICQSMLKSPTSKLKADVDRRANVRARVVEFNDALKAACATITTKASSTACKFDDNAVFNTSFSLTDISKVDYFHPSVSGQAKLAAVTYTAFGFPAG
jgi:lysophospholipase L1-like esterase